MDFEAAVIGSGFGGAILIGRMARKWGEKVVVLPRWARTLVMWHDYAHRGQLEIAVVRMNGDVGSGELVTMIHG